MKTLRRLMQPEKLTAAAKERVMGARPYVYLYQIGVTTRGAGVGGAVMREVCRVADVLQRPIFLENSKQANVPFYERHGFVMKETMGITNDDDAPTLWIMVREPGVAEFIAAP